MKSNIKNIKLYVMIALTTVSLMFISPLLNEAIKANTDRVSDKITTFPDTRGLSASKNSGKPGYSEYMYALKQDEAIQKYVTNNAVSKMNTKWKKQTNVKKPHELESNFTIPESKAPELKYKVPGRTPGIFLNESFQYDPVGMRKLEGTAKREINYTYTYRDLLDDLGAFCSGWGIPLPQTVSKNLGEKSQDGELEKTTKDAVDSGLKSTKNKIIDKLNQDREKDLNNPNAGVDNSNLEFKNVDDRDYVDVNYNGAQTDLFHNYYYNTPEDARNSVIEELERKERIKKRQAEAGFNEAKKEIINGQKITENIETASEPGSRNFNIQGASALKSVNNTRTISPRLGYIGATWLQKNFYEKENTRFVPNRIDEELYLYTEGMLKGKKIKQNGAWLKRKFPTPLQYAFYTTTEVKNIWQNIGKTGNPKLPPHEYIMHPDYVIVKDGKSGSVADQLIKESEIYEKFINKLDERARTYDSEKQNLKLKQEIHIDSGSQKDRVVHWKAVGYPYQGSNQRKLIDPATVSGKYNFNGQEAKKKIFKNPKIKYLPKLVYGKSENQNGNQNINDKRDLIVFNSEKQQWIIGPLYLDYEMGLVDEDISHTQVQTTQGARFAGIIDMKLKGRYDKAQKSDRYAESNDTIRYDIKPINNQVKPVEDRPQGSKAGRIRKEPAKTQLTSPDYPSPQSKKGYKYAIEEKDEEENLVDIRSWDIIYPKKKKEYKRDKEYRAPYSKEEFYLTIDYDDRLLSIDKFRVEFAYQTYSGEMGVFEGAARSLENIQINKQYDDIGVRSVTRYRSGTKAVTVDDYDDEGNYIGSHTKYVEYPEPFTGYIPDGGYTPKTSIKGNYKKITSQPLVTYAGVRWYEFVMLDADLKLKAKDEDDLTSIGSLPIGGKVWEDKPQGVKHLGYDHIFSKTTDGNPENKDKALEGIRVRVNRLVLRITPENGKDTTKAPKIEEIVSKEEARLYKKPKNKQRNENDEVSGPIYTNKDGDWGIYYIYQIGLTKEEKKKYPKNHVVKFEVVYDYDGLYYEPVLPLQKLNEPKNEKLAFDDSSTPNGNKYNATSTEEKKKYFNSSFVAERPDDRYEFSKSNAEIIGKNKITSNLETEGKTYPSVTGKGNGRDIKYKGEINKSNNKYVDSKYVPNSPKENEKLPKEEYYNKFMEASTLSIGLAFPTTDKFSFNKTDKIIKNVDGENIQGVDGIYASTENMSHINMGLKKRWIDLGITKNLTNAFVTVNKKAASYPYNNVYANALTDDEKNELYKLNLTEQINGKAKKENKDINIYKTDYIYRTSMYSSNPTIKALIDKELNQEKSLDNNGNTKYNPRQLDVFLTYNVTVYNDSLKDAALISQLNDIVADKLELVNYTLKKRTQLEDPEENIEKNGGNLKEKDVEISRPTYTVKDSKSEVKKYLDTPEYTGKNISKGNNLDTEYDANNWKESKERIPNNYANNKMKVYQTRDNSSVSGNNPNYLIYPGERIEFKLVFRVKNASDITQIEDKDALGILKDPKSQGINKLGKALELGAFKNEVEIGAFASYDILTGQVTAKVDKDSAPSNYDQTSKLKEDDTDEAETIRLQIPKNVDKKRVLKGKLFEDLRNVKNQNGIITGDGKYTEKEDRALKKYPVMLEERVTFKKGSSNEFVDKTFIWPEKIKTEDIELDLLKATGYESVVETNDKGEYTFTGVPAGNFVLSTYYTSPSKETMKQFINDENNIQKYITQDNTLSRISEYMDISPNDLKSTQNNNVINRKEKWYNGIGFKNTMFYNNNQDNTNISWLNKKRDTIDGNISYSFARDDEARRTEITKKFETFKNNNLEMLKVFREPNIDNIDRNDLKEAHKHTTIKTMTPKLDFSVDYFENLEKAQGENKQNKKEYKNGIAIIYDYKDNQSTQITYEISNINLGMAERPETKVVVNKELTNLKLITADGNEIVDLKYTYKPIIDNNIPNPENNNFNKNLDFTSKITKFERVIDRQNSKGVESVLTLDRTELQDGSVYDKIKKKISQSNLNPGFRYINVDESLIQDATLQANYEISVYNLSEIDSKIEYNKLDLNKVNEYRENANFTGRLEENNKQGVNKHEYDSKYSFGNIVDKSYYKPTNKITNSKIKIKQLADYASNSTTVKLDNELNKEWQVADKTDLIGLIRGVSDTKTAQAAKYLDSRGEEYIKSIASIRNINGQNVSNNNLSSNILLLKQEGKELEPLSKGNMQNSSQIWKIQLSKTFASNGDKNASIENVAELLAYSSENSKNNYDITGNYITELDVKAGHGSGLRPGDGRDSDNPSLIEEQITYATTASEIDTSSTEIITLSPPTGLSNLGKKKMHTIYIISGVSVAIIISIVTIVIYKRKRNSVNLHS